MRALHQWWLGKGGALGAPDREALDPSELRSLLPNLLIAEAEHNPFRVRYRLIGTKVVEVTGLDITGRYLDELLSAEPDQPWISHYRTVYDTQRPLLGSTIVPTSAGSMFTYEFGIFPLRNGGERVEQFIAVEDYFDLQSTLIQVEPWRKKDERRL